MATELQRGKGVPALAVDTPDLGPEAVVATKQAINERFGRFKLRSAATLYLPAAYRNPANSFDICDVRGKIGF